MGMLQFLISYVEVKRGRVPYEAEKLADGSCLMMYDRSYISIALLAYKNQNYNVILFTLYRYKSIFCFNFQLTDQRDSIWNQKLTVEVMNAMTIKNLILFLIFFSSRVLFFSICTYFNVTHIPCKFHSIRTSRSRVT